MENKTTSSKTSTNDLKQESYDFIFLGSGCAALSLLTRMADSGKFSDKKILLLERAPKINNDRTWCFWENEAGYFEQLVYRKWNNLKFNSSKGSIDLDIKPYLYKMIRGIDFYNHCFEKINHLNITSLYGEIILPSEKEASILFNGQPLKIDSAVVFNSIYQPSAAGSSVHLRQHFKGWIIETESEKFQSSEATLMDFNITQKHGACFVYTLPLSSSKALIEYTVFSEKLLTQQAYVDELKSYIHKNLGIDYYKISEEEFGVIPMTTQKFSFFSNGMYNIGTAGGQTKASTGYTFRFIQKQSDELIKQLIQYGKPMIKQKRSCRFKFYDDTFLHVLASKKNRGADVFEMLFRRNKAHDVFKFLDNETSIKEDLKIISSLPKWEFLKAAFSLKFRV